MPRKMLSRRQCLFVVVILPMLIVPALIIIQHADGRTDEVFVPPRRPVGITRSAARALMIPYNISAGKYSIIVDKSMSQSQSNKHAIDTSHAIAYCPVRSLVFRKSHV